MSPCAWETPVPGDLLSSAGAGASSFFTTGAPLLFNSILSILAFRLPPAVPRQWQSGGGPASDALCPWVAGSEMSSAPCTAIALSCRYASALCRRCRRRLRIGKLAEMPGRSGSRCYRPVSPRRIASSRSAMPAQRADGPSAGRNDLGSANLPSGSTTDPRHTSQTTVTSR